MSVSSLHSLMRKTEYPHYPQKPYGSVRIRRGSSSRSIGATGLSNFSNHTSYPPFFHNKQQLMDQFFYSYIDQNEKHLFTRKLTDEEKSILKLDLEISMHDSKEIHQIAPRMVASAKFLKLPLEEKFYSTRGDLSLDSIKQEDLDKAFQWACYVGHVEWVRFLLQDKRFNPSEQSDLVLNLSINNHHIEVTELLLKDPRIDPSANDNYPLIAASYRGNIPMVQLLLQHPKVDPSARDNYPLIVAFNTGYTEVGEVLRRDYRFNPIAGGNFALYYACSQGNIALVKFLLRDPRVNREEIRNYGRREALKKGHTPIVELLDRHHEVASIAGYKTYEAKFTQLVKFLDK